MNDRPGNSTCTVTMAPPACPNCRQIFKDTSAVLKHMNHWFASCHLWFTNNQPSPTPPPHPPSTETDTSYYFPDAGHIFGSGPGFMQSFSNNEDAGVQSTHPYHPFLSKDEWEIAGFLSCSGLSMSLIDKFLSLNSVSLFDRFESLKAPDSNCARLQDWACRFVAHEPSGQK